MKAFLALLFIVWLYIPIIAQNRTHSAKLALVQYSKKSYNAAIPYFRKAIRKQPSNDTLIVDLAMSYYYTRQLPKANKAFSFLDQRGLLKDSLKLFYLRTLKQQGQYIKVQKWIQKQQDTSFASELAFCDSAIAWIKKTKPIKLTNLKELNTEYTEYHQSMHPEGLYFLSNRESVLIEKKTGSDGLPYQRAYLSSYRRDSTLGKPSLYHGLSSTDYHAGAAHFVEDSSFVYYTKVVRDRDNVLRSKLYLRGFGKKSNLPPKLFVFNDSLFSYLHPCVDKAQQFFFFASDMAGGYGGTDLYVSIVLNQQWSDPINLGPLINSSHNEISPYYDSMGRLFFSSDRPEGMGGYDLFVAFQNEGEWEYIQNLRAPVNTCQDELGWVWNKSMTKAYISSNRSGGLGREDLYEISGKLLFLFDK